MAEKLTLKLSAAAAVYAGKDATREMKIQAAQGEVSLSERDLATLLYLLAHDPDPEVKGKAILTLRQLDDARVLVVADNPATHPRILDMLARLHFQKRDIAAKLLSNPSIEERTAEFLTAKEVQSVEAEEPEQAVQADEDTGGMEENEEVDEESEEFQSKFQLCLKMEVSEKIKMALVGDKEWRTLLIRDSNRLVTSAVLKNPRITEGEILAVAQSAVQNDDMMRIICSNKEWLKNYQIRKALVQNCKTPLQTALRILMTLSEKDLALLARNKNIPSVISTQARRQLFNKRYKNQ